MKLQGDCLRVQTVCGRVWLTHDGQGGAAQIGTMCLQQGGGEPGGHSAGEVLQLEL
jgi:hypothetical protein